MFCTHVAWLCLVCLLLCKEEGSSPVTAITEMRDVGLYEVSLLGFGMGTMLANFHMLSREIEYWSWVHGMIKSKTRVI